MSLLGPGFNVTAVLGLSFGIQNSRIIRGAALSVKENAYIEAAQAFGSSNLRIMLHLLLMWRRSSSWWQRLVWAI
jgi:peptide/nickel transport system permease protein